MSLEGYYFYITVYFYLKEDYYIYELRELQFPTFILSGILFVYDNVLFANILFIMDLISLLFSVCQSMSYLYGIQILFIIYCFHVYNSCSWVILL